MSFTRAKTTTSLVTLASPRQSRTFTASSIGPRWSPLSPITPVQSVAAASPSITSHLALIVSSRSESDPGTQYRWTSLRDFLCLRGMTILVVVFHLTKMALFIPTFQDIDAEDLAHIFLSQVFAKHGTPTDIVSDCRKHFISRFWRSVCQLLGIKANLSTAYHPETDGQTE